MYNIPIYAQRAHTMQSDDESVALNVNIVAKRI